MSFHGYFCVWFGIFVRSHEPDTFFFDIRVGLFQSIHFNPFPPRAPDKHDPYVHITLVFNHNEVAEHKHPQAAA